MDPAQSPRIALLIGTAFGFARGVLRGVNSYASPDRGWICHYYDPATIPFDQVAQWQPHGVIAAVTRDDMEDEIEQLRVPAVNVSSALADSRCARVTVDNAAIGELAARYFLNRGHRRFAFLGLSCRDYSIRRLDGFARTVRKAGFECLHHQDSTDRSEQRAIRSFIAHDQGLRDWVRGLPRPIAVLAANDFLGMQLAEAARLTQVRVPEDLAIVGVDNDDLSTPPLSSVELPGHRIGYDAAAMLDDLLCGRTPQRRKKELPPVRVVTRRSSDALAIEDQEVAACVRFIRTHCHKPISVDQVVQAGTISRRSLERRFRQALGRSPLEEIRRMQVENAQSLLAATDLPMPAVASRCGMVSAERLSVMFRQETGQTPTAYRRQFRLGRDEAAGEAS